MVEDRWDDPEQDGCFEDVTDYKSMPELKKKIHQKEN